MTNNLKKKLYFFTASFPFGLIGENFIENEINHLSKSFEEITIIPLCCYKNGSIIRSVPDNCKVLRSIITSRFQHYFVGLFCLKTIHLFSKDFLDKKVFKNLKWVKMFLIDLCTTNNLLQSRALMKVLREIQKDDVLYFYWGKGPANLLPFLPKTYAKKVVRFHSGDLYQDNYGGYLPIQEAILKGTDKAVFISKHGQKYLRIKYPELIKNSIVSYLGTNDIGISKKSNDNIFRLLSCSDVIPLKRLFLLHKTLQSITNYEIEWTHIGDGKDFKRLKYAVQKSRNNVKIKLLGLLSNQEVLNFYQTNMIDAFINVSITEGLPVSLMEAISCNVPVIATDVGGTSEIVTSETGILLSSNPSVSDIIDALNKIRYIELQPRLFWERNFNSAINYPKFINEILIS